MVVILNECICRYSPDPTLDDSIRVPGRATYTTIATSLLSSLKHFRNTDDDISGLLDRGGP